MVFADARENFTTEFRIFFTGTSKNTKNEKKNSEIIFYKSLSRGFVILTTSFYLQLLFSSITLLYIACFLALYL